MVEIFCEHKLSSLQLDSHMKDKDHKWVATVDYPRSACGVRLRESILPGSCIDWSFMHLIHSFVSSFPPSKYSFSNLRSTISGSSIDMEEFKEKEDEVSHKKRKGDELHDEKEINNCPPSNNDFHLNDAKSDTVFIQEKDFKSDPANYSARTEPPRRTKQMSNLEVDGESNHRTTLKCSKEFSGKCNCNAPCLAMALSYQDPTLAKDVTPTNISSASISTPAKVVLPMDAARRNNNGKVASYHINCGGKVSSTHQSASKMEKGKEPIIYEADDSRSSSNRREDGSENLECVSSRGIVSTAKRARIYDSEFEKPVGGKRLRRLNNWNSSSFMNWATTITNGLIRPQGPMEAFQPSQRMKAVISSPISHEEREYTGVSHGTRGFRSIFQAVYNPGKNLSSNKIKNVDHQKEIGALKGIEGETASNVACCELHEREKENFSTGSVILGSNGIAPRENDIELHEKVLASSKSFNKDVCQVKNSPSATMDSRGELMVQSSHAFQNSLWVARLSRGDSSSQLKGIQCSNSLDLSAQHKFPYLEARENSLSEKQQHKSVSHTDSHVSARIVTENYESKLQLTISSKYSKRSKPMASSFAQKLYALEHSKPSEITNVNTSSNKVCLFCGTSDHSIRECSEVVETKLDQYLKSISLYDSIKKASCFCILCLQLDHWAVSCANASSNGNQITFKANGFSDVHFKITEKKKDGNQSFINYEGAIMLQSEGKKDHHQVLHGSTVSQKENEAMETDIVVFQEVRSHNSESSGCGTINLLMDGVEDTINTDKMKMISSCSLENELRKSEFKSFCSHLPTTVMSEPKGIFVAVRKLHLSRMDVLRWMKSGARPYNLVGFFLRLRIGKLEKGLGGTGYFVGCINGESCQSSISVCVGTSTYLVTSAFISNQDFKEDELMAWWFQNLRDGTKMPSSEELNEKFQLRIKFGF